MFAGGELIAAYISLRHWGDVFGCRILAQLKMAMWPLKMAMWGKDDHPRIHWKYWNSKYPTFSDPQISANHPHGYESIAIFIFIPFLEG